MKYSFIIPVFNRPDEIRELLESLVLLTGNQDFEVVIVEDGSQQDSALIIDQFKSKLNILYLQKENTGPGDSRNYGMVRASGDYFIILDSDCILPPDYLNRVKDNLKRHFVDCYGGPDKAHNSFSTIQKAINFAMTSFVTTGGVRGGKGADKDFQPRSFNMGLSKKAFTASGGFGSIHPGEDPDLAIRLKKLGFKTKLFSDAFLFHKRRISWAKFYRQVHNFGLVRPILNKWHPAHKKVTYWFPTIFLLGLCAALILTLFGKLWPFILYSVYFLLIFLVSLISEKNVGVAVNSVIAVAIQFLGYGYGFLKSYMAIHLLNKDPKEHYPQLFF